MIAADFAPNEDHSDAEAAASVLIHPSRWYEGSAADEARRLIGKILPGNRHVYFFTARAALYCYLRALNLPPHSEILVTGLTCEAVVIPIKALGHIPVYVDIDLETYSMDPAVMENKASNRTALIILQHTYGIPPHRTKILAFAKRYKIPVLEDLAHGFDTRIFRNDSGQSDKLLSFGTSKAMSSVYGGALLTQNSDLYKKLLHEVSELPFPSDLFMFRTLIYKPLHIFMKDTYDIMLGRIVHKALNILRVFPKVLSKTERALGLDPYVLKKYPNGLALLLVHQLNKFGAMQATRAASTSYYAESQGSPLGGLPLGRFPLLVKDRDGLMRRMAQRNIFLGRWYHYVLGEAGECPVAEHVSRHIINLPTLVTLDEARQVIAALDNEIVLH